MFYRPTQPNDLPRQSGRAYRERMIDRIPATGSICERLKAMVRAIADGVEPSRVILFGSRARGDASPDSDYDLVVELAFDRADYWPTYHRVSATLGPVKNGVSIDVL